MAFIVLGVFWASVVFAFFVIDAKTALTFAGLWIAGLFMASALHLSGFFFLAYEAILAAILCIQLKMEWS